MGQFLSYVAYLLVQSLAILSCSSLIKSQLMLMFCSEQLLPIVDVLGGDAADQGIAGVAVGQEGADGEEDLGDGESWAPLVLQNVQTDDALGVDIAVVDSGPELHFRRLEGIIGGEMNIQEEDASLIDRSRRAEDGAHPLVQIVALGTRAAVGGRIQ